MTDADRQAIAKEIADLTRPPRLKPHEITKIMLAEEEGIPPHKAVNWLKRGVRLKLLKVRKVKLDGKWTNAYSERTPVMRSVTNGDQDNPGPDELEL